MNLSTALTMNDEYQSPFNLRYCSKAMSELFSPRNRRSIWRKLWIWLAKAEKELGLSGISDEAISQMEKHAIIQDDEFAIIAEEVKRRRHDVMAHVNHLQ